MEHRFQTEYISSAQNPKVKHLLALQEKSRLRRSEGLFVVEGLREVRHALEAGLEADSLFVCPEIFDAAPAEDRDAICAAVNPPGCGLETAVNRAGNRFADGNSAGMGMAVRILEVPAALYGRIALRGSTEGIVGIFHTLSNRPEDLSLPENALVVVLENIEKPGNIGAVLRSADGAGADALIVCHSSARPAEDPHSPRTDEEPPRTDEEPSQTDGKGGKTGTGCIDLYNPNIIRSSLGAVFTVPVAVCESAEAIAFLKARGIRILTAQLQDSKPYYDVDMTGATALVIGSEADGLSEAWREAADRHILIPMDGRMDSLNASVSAAVLLYEARRQRGAKTTGRQVL